MAAPPPHAATPAPVAAQSPELALILNTETTRSIADLTKDEQGNINQELSKNKLQQIIQNKSFLTYYKNTIVKCNLMPLLMPPVKTPHSLKIKNQYILMIIDQHNLNNTVISTDAEIARLMMLFKFTNIMTRIITQKQNLPDIAVIMLIHRHIINNYLNMTTVKREPDVNHGNIQNEIYTNLVLFISDIRRGSGSADVVNELYVQNLIELQYETILEENFNSFALTNDLDIELMKNIIKMVYS